MKRRFIFTLLVAVPIAAFIWWVADNTYWVETSVPMPLKGEALRNPFYAAQRFAEALGARTSWDRAFTTPPPGAAVVLSGWHWSLTPRRRESVERWVESGGRLVIDGSLAAGEDEFAAWSGIARESRKLDETELELPHTTDRCRSFLEHGEGSAAPAPEGDRRVLCDVDDSSSLSTNKHVTWMLRDASGIQAVRVRVGKGSVTVMNAEPFQYRNLLEADHARVFVSATQLRRHDDVRFLSEDEHPSLLALVWYYGAPAVVLGLGVVALHLWRTAARFGPLAAPPQRARRSLAEQIRGTGAFAWRHGGGESLHAACVRALDEAAQRRIPRYSLLPAKERAAAVARLTGFDWNALLAAVHDPRARRPHELRSTLALLEEARRRTLVTQRSHAHA